MNESPAFEFAQMSIRAAFVIILFLVLSYSQPFPYLPL